MALEAQTTEAQTTIVLLGYFSWRIPHLKQAVSRYSRMQNVQRIILVWNNLETPCPIDSDDKITIIHSAVNSLNNRFNVSNIVLTETILSIDDDFLISEQGIAKLLNSYQNKHAITGFHCAGSIQSYYITKGNIDRMPYGRSIIRMLGHDLALTGIALIPTSTLKLYMQHTNILNMVDNFTNCEDISMNYVFWHETGFDSQCVQSTQEDFEVKRVKGKKGLSERPKSGYYKQRDRCLTILSRYFRIFPGDAP